MPSKLDNVVPVNVYDLSQLTINDTQTKVANAQGRKVLFAEFVLLNGYFGDVTDQDGIANGESGFINIDSDRIVRTEQITTSETFVVGNTAWFGVGGAGAAGLIVDSDPGGTSAAIGIITGFGGTAGTHTYIEFRPFVQLQINVASISTLQGEMLVEQAEPKILVFKVIIDASGALAIPGLVVGDEIIAVSVICTAANGSGTLVLEDGDGDDITDGIACDTDEAVDYMATLDNSKSTLPASGAQVISVGGTAANTRGIMIITYIPA